jgi:ubiquinol-cytochrome c reductase cytochrome c subunit
MPKFGPETIDQRQLDSLAAYLEWLHDNGGEGGLQLGRVGAVAEGLVAVVIGLGILILVLRLTGAKR